MMDELLKALVNAINTGTALAYPGLIGYFVIRALEMFQLPVALFIIGRAVLSVVKALIADRPMRYKQSALQFLTKFPDRSLPDWARMEWAPGAPSEEHMVEIVKKG